ncbi:MAG: glycosyltransferase family 4 protein [Patescibacteria group bacterium]|jgi:glycosyltransferase involved in cell wall biosynthesis
MRILFIADWFPPYSTGGAEQIVFNLVNGFKAKGYEVFVISTVQDQSLAENGNNGVYRIYVPDYHPRWKAYRSLYNPVAVREIKKLVKEIRPDIIHTHNLHYYSSYGVLKIAKKYCPKVFLTAHDVQLFHYGKLVEFIDQGNLAVPQTFNYQVSIWQQLKRYKKRYNPFRNAIINHYLKYVDKIFAVSDALADALKQNGIKNVAVVHNGIDQREWEITDLEISQFKKKFNLLDKRVVFFGGRLSALKGGRELILATAEVKKSVPNVVLLVVGRNDQYLNEISDFAKSQGVILLKTGWLKGKELAAAYGSSSVVVVPSVCFDSFPTVNLEAMACQRPVIATCFGGSRELVEDNKTGFIINPLDIKTMAEKIKLILNDDNLAKNFGDNGYDKIKNHFTVEHQINNLLKFYL